MCLPATFPYNMFLSLWVSNFWADSLCNFYKALQVSTCMLWTSKIFFDEVHVDILRVYTDTKHLAIFKQAGCLFSAPYETKFFVLQLIQSWHNTLVHRNLPARDFYVSKALFCSKFDWCSRPFIISLPIIGHCMGLNVEPVIKIGLELHPGLDLWSRYGSRPSFGSIQRKLYFDLVTSPNSYNRARCSCYGRWWSRHTRSSAASVCSRPTLLKNVKFTETFGTC